MKIVQTDGCVVGNITFDGVSIYNVDQARVLDYLLPKLRAAVLAGECNLNDVVGLFQYDDFHMDDHSCDQCGDTVSTTTWNL